MGSSTTTIDSIVDYVSSLGELSPILPVGGFSTSAALGIANDVMADLLGKRFPWKWNRMKIAPFYTNSYQQDYAQIGLATLAWLENGYWVDINNTSLPKPTYALEAVRDLSISSITGNPPAKVCWFPNNQLTQGIWPGANTTYVQPLGAVQTPTNGPTNILDANGNILVLTTYGTTGSIAPSLPPSSAEGTTAPDGSCVWTVAGPNSQGFRILPMPPPQGVIYQINLVGQMKPPPLFTTTGAVINPIPDDYAQEFREGFIVYCYRMSPNPQMQQLYDKKRGLWLEAIHDAMIQGDRETDAAGFTPDRSVVAPQGGYDIGPANPYLYNVWPGR